MRITLIQTETGGSYPPLSLGALAAVAARAGHEPLILDLQIPAQLQDWEQRLVDAQPQLVGFTALTPSINQAGRLVRRCRELLPDVPTIVGGFHATMEPEQTLADHPFDYACVGEGEETLVELADRLDRGEPAAGMAGLAWREGDGVAFGPGRERITDLDALPQPHGFYDLAHYLDAGSFTYQYGYRCASIISSRGCPFRCRFCSLPGQYIQQSVPRLCDEIETVLGRGADGVFFRDSTFTIRREWVMAFCEAVQRRRLRFHWIANARPDRVDEAMLGAMRRAGCFALCYGVETGRDHILEYYGKDHTVADTRRAVAATQAAGIRVIAYLMLGAPIETRADIEASVELARELHAERTIWKIFAPLPGCAIYDELKAKGVPLDFDAIRTDSASYPLEDMTEAEIEARFRELASEFRYVRDSRVRRFLRQLRDARSPADVWRLGARTLRSLTHRGAR